jgi:hypothetical protein
MTTTTHSHKHWTDKGGHVTSPRQESCLMGARRGAGSGNGTGFRVGGATGACGVAAAAGESLRGSSSGAAGEGSPEEGASGDWAAGEGGGGA